MKGILTDTMWRWWVIPDLLAPAALVAEPWAVGENFLTSGRTSMAGTGASCIVNHSSGTAEGVLPRSHGVATSGAELMALGAMFV
jgi:hypothetical protein